MPFPKLRRRPFAEKTDVSIIYLEEVALARNDIWRRDIFPSIEEVPRVFHNDVRDSEHANGVGMILFRRSGNDARK